MPRKLLRDIAGLAAFFSPHPCPRLETVLTTEAETVFTDPMTTDTKLPFDRTVAFGDDAEYKQDVFRRLDLLVGREAALRLMDLADEAIVHGWRANTSVVLLCEVIVDYLVKGERHDDQHYEAWMAGYFGQVA